MPKLQLAATKQSLDLSTWPFSFRGERGTKRLKGTVGDMQSGSDVNGGAPERITHLYLFLPLSASLYLPAPSISLKIGILVISNTLDKTDIWTLRVFSRFYKAVISVSLVLLVPSFHIFLPTTSQSNFVVSMTSILSGSLVVIVT